MANTNNKLYYNPSYAAGMIQASQHLYDSPQELTPAEYEMVRLSSVSSSVPMTKEVISSNVQHQSNGVSNQIEERIKWSIVMILLITSTLLNVFVVITLYTKQTSCPPVSCPPVINTTQMAYDDIAQAGYVSCGNTTDEMILQLLVNYNITTLIDMVSDNTRLLDGTIKNVTASLQQLSTSQSILENISNENKGTINNILVNVLENQNKSFISSCQDIKNKSPGSPSGYYHINRQLVYCEMGELCSSEGGWTRLAYLDMNDSTVDCPLGFKLYEDNGVRACGRPATQNGSCGSIEFPSNGISYSEVCGRVVGYQFGSTNALYTSNRSIDSPYVDGVSITQGYPRKHVWTLIAGLYSTSTTTDYLSNCPCNTPPGFTRDINMFIGNDFFCESGNPVSDDYSFKVYSDDPLWDGKECVSQEQDCCLANGLPWFHKTLNSTTDYLELRVCCNQGTAGEDVPISLYELYVK